jgi:hypothetical protein
LKEHEVSSLNKTIPIRNSVSSFGKLVFSFGFIQKQLRFDGIVNDQKTNELAQLKKQMN